MKFEHVLLEAQAELITEQSMSASQRKEVQKLGRSGWDFKKKDGDKVVLSKNDKEVFVYQSGETFFLTESGKEIEVDSELIDALHGEE